MFARVTDLLQHTTDHHLLLCDIFYIYSLMYYASSFPCKPTTPLYDVLVSYLGTPILYSAFKVRFIFYLAVFLFYVFLIRVVV